VRDVNLNLQALQQGAMGVVTKDQASENLIQAIQKINAGEAWLDGVTTAKMITYLADLSSRPDPEAAKIGALTQREYKIIQLVCEGHKNQGIADCLLISEGTVRNHLTVIYHKLGVKDRFGLIVYATQHKLNHPADPIPIAPD
jgi:two-component system, NarL family, nitrate/nitrite response regulator NarL